MIAFVPARSGSTRIPHKNIKLLAGHPLLAYSIRAAVDSGIFDAVYLATDSLEYAEIGDRYGAAWWRRKESPPNEPDFEWVKGIADMVVDYFAILRPTSPFRTAETIKRAWSEFDKTADSMRAVSPAKTNPYKMWWASERWKADTGVWVIHPRMQPIMDDCVDVGVPRMPLHSVASQTLPPAWAQNASLEIAHSYVIERYGNISGYEVQPFFSQGYEGLDLNTQDDWDYAEFLVQSGKAKLPEVE